MSSPPAQYPFMDEVSWLKPGVWRWSRSHSELHNLAGAGAGAGATLTLWLLWLRPPKLESSHGVRMDRKPLLKRRVGAAMFTKNGLRSIHSQGFSKHRVYHWTFKGGRVHSHPSSIAAQARRSQFPRKPLPSRMARNAMAHFFTPFSMFERCWAIRSHFSVKMCLNSDMPLTWFLCSILGT